jgi:cellulose 1,4-beta-cellobiosidase
MMILLLPLVLSVLRFSHAQFVGTIEGAEIQPTLTWEACTASGCNAQKSNLTLDANWRWYHDVNSSTNCIYTNGGWNATLCPDPVTCAKNCAVDSMDIASYLGSQVKNDSLRSASTNPCL